MRYVGTACWGDVTLAPFRFWRLTTATMLGCIICMPPLPILHRRRVRQPVNLKTVRCVAATMRWPAHLPFVDLSTWCSARSTGCPTPCSLRHFPSMPMHLGAPVSARQVCPGMFALVKCRCCPPAGVTQGRTQTLFQHLDWSCIEWYNVKKVFYPEGTPCAARQARRWEEDDWDSKPTNLSSHLVLCLSRLDVCCCGALVGCLYRCSVLVQGVPMDVRCVAWPDELTTSSFGLHLVLRLRHGTFATPVCPEAGRGVVRSVCMMNKVLYRADPSWLRTIFCIFLLTGRCRTAATRAIALSASCTGCIVVLALRWLTWHWRLTSRVCLSALRSCCRLSLCHHCL